MKSKLIILFLFIGLASCHLSNLSDQIKVKSDNPNWICPHYYGHNADYDICFDTTNGDTYLVGQNKIIKIKK